MHIGGCARHSMSPINIKISVRSSIKTTSNIPSTNEYSSKPKRSWYPAFVESANLKFKTAPAHLPEFSDISVTSESVPSPGIYFVSYWRRWSDVPLKNCQKQRHLWISGRFIWTKEYSFDYVVEVSARKGRKGKTGNRCEKRMRVGVSSSFYKWYFICWKCLQIHLYIFISNTQYNQYNQLQSFIYFWESLLDDVFCDICIIILIILIIMMIFIQFLKNLQIYETSQIFTMISKITGIDE